jgi:hypothetical protein
MLLYPEQSSRLIRTWNSSVKPILEVRQARRLGLQIGYRMAGLDDPEWNMSYGAHLGSLDHQLLVDQLIFPIKQAGIALTKPRSQVTVFC